MTTPYDPPQTADTALVPQWLRLLLVPHLAHALEHADARFAVRAVGLHRRVHGVRAVAGIGKEAREVSGSRASGRRT
jgi:hypothetical protein